MGLLHPLNIFLRQEIDRMQKVITTVRNTLKDLKLAIEGTIIMSENLRDALDSMYDARIPSSWKKVGSAEFTEFYSRFFTKLFERLTSISKSEMFCDRFHLNRCLLILTELFV